MTERLIRNKSNRDYVYQPSNTSRLALRGKNISKGKYMNLRGVARQSVCKQEIKQDVLNHGLHRMESLRDSMREIMHRSIEYI